MAVGGHGVRPVRWAKRFLTFAELPEEAAFRRSYTLYGADEVLDVISPDLKECVADVVQEHEDVYADTKLATTSTECASPTRGSSSPVSTSHIPTGRAWRRRPKFACRSWTSISSRAAFALRGSDKVRGRQGKRASRLAAEEWLPRDIVYRPKASFGAPIRAWVSRDLRPLVDEVLLDGQLVNSGVLQHAGVSRLVEEDRQGRQDRAKQIWQLLSLELWYQRMTELGVGSIAT